MRKGILAIACIATLAAVAVAATLQPLNVKTGLWEMTETVTWKGLPPQLQASMASGQTHSYQTCVKTQDLSSNPWAEGSGEHCTWTVLNSTGTDMEVHGTACSMGAGFGMTAEAHGNIHVLDPENGTGSFDVTMSGNGQTLNGHASYQGKWVGASCPAQ